MDIRIYAFVSLKRITSVPIRIRRNKYLKLPKRIPAIRNVCAQREEEKSQIYISEIYTNLRHVCNVGDACEGRGKNRDGPDQFVDSRIPDVESNPLGMQQNEPATDTSSPRCSSRPSSNHYHATTSPATSDLPCRRIHLTESLAVDAKSVLLYLCTCSLASRMDANLLHQGIGDTTWAEYAQPRGCS